MPRGAVVARLCALPAPRNPPNKLRQYSNAFGVARSRTGGGVVEVVVVGCWWARSVARSAAYVLRNNLERFGKMRAR